jgi:hypothetical protein
MNLPADEPEWECLPHDPIGFFRLAPIFDRRDLRRQYSQLIRHYKPEQHPAEFQRIRAAYESLDLKLRYGTNPADESATLEYRRPAESLQMNAVPLVAAIDNSSQSHLALDVRLQSVPPEVIYSELRGIACKTTTEYYALALLSDIVETDPNETFAGWLLAGLGNSPQDRGLHVLLRQYLSGPIPTESIPQLLIVLSRHVSEQIYFPLTERLWQQLLRANDFECFRGTLSNCEKNLLGLNIDARVTFYIQILRLAIWQADPTWIERSISYIEEHFRHIPQRLDNEVDLLLELQSYVSRRLQFIGDDPLRVRMDAALQGYFFEDEVLGDQRFIECQRSLVQDYGALRNAFPDVEEQTLPLFYSLWNITSHDVAYRNVGDEREEVLDDLWRVKTWSLLERIDSRTGWSKVGITWGFARLAIGLLVFAVGLAAIAAVGSVCAVFANSGILRQEYDDLALAFYSMISIGAGIFVGFWFNKYIRRRWTDAFNARMAWQAYRQLWQPEVFSLLERSQMKIPTMLSYMAHGNAARASNWRWLFHYVQRDFALAFYSMAQRFIA